MYTIVTDTCIDMDLSLLKEFTNYEILPLSYTMNGVTSTQPLTTKEAIHEYYDKLRAGIACKTSQVTPGQFYECYRECAKRGEPVLSLQFASALSGTYASALAGRDMTLEEYPNAVIEVIDTCNASVGQGLIFYDALLNRKKGMSLEENKAWIIEHLSNYIGWFTVDDLNFLKRGGRCSPSAAFFGTMLKIKPVLEVNAKGELIARQKVRGRQQAFRVLAEKYNEQCTDREHVVFISHGDCESDAEQFKNMLVQDYGCKPEKIILSGVGPVIGSHTGPGVVTIFFYGKRVS